VSIPSSFLCSAAMLERWGAQATGRRQVRSFQNGGRCGLWKKYGKHDSNHRELKLFLVRLALQTASSHSASTFDISMIRGS